MQRTDAKAKVHSVNVSGPLRHVPFAGQIVTTGFYKSPVKGDARAHKLGIAGDAQADLTVHGGRDKAVYFYPLEHYASWEKLLDAGSLPLGCFGENVTSEGLLESDLNVGDILQIGTAVLQVLQPRSPCYKLQMRFGRPDMTALFFHQQKPGWYASVLQEGVLAAGDEIVMIERAPEGITIADIWSYSTTREVDRSTIERVFNLKLLPDFWKSRIARHFPG